MNMSGLEVVGGNYQMTVPTDECPPRFTGWNYNGES